MQFVIAVFGNNNKTFIIASFGNNNHVFLLLLLAIIIVHLILPFIAIIIMVWNIILPFKAVEIHIHYQLIHEIHWISFQGHSKVSQKSLSERTIFYPAIIAISAQLSEHLAEDADDAAVFLSVTSQLTL